MVQCSGPTRGGDGRAGVSMHKTCRAREASRRATVWPGPAQARPQPGRSQISGNLEIWNLEIWKFGIQQNPKKEKSSKIKIRVAQNVGKVWISRKKSSWPHLGPSGPIFCVGRKNPKNIQILPIFLGGPMGPIHPVWGNGCNISSAIHIGRKFLAVPAPQSLIDSFIYSDCKIE